MKPFLCTDVTNDKNNKTVNGQEFVCQQSNQAFLQSYESACRQYDEQRKKVSKKVLPYLVVFSILYLAVAIVFLFLIKKTPDIVFDSELGKTLFMVSGIVICAIIVLFFQHLNKKTINKAKDNKDYEYTNSKRLLALNAVLEDLQVPQDAFDVDVLSFSYKDKDGQISRNKLKKVALCSFRLWTDENNLYLADANTKYCFEKNSFVSIKKHYTGADVYFADEYIEHDSIEQTRDVAYYKGNYSIGCYYLLNYDDGTRQTCIYITQFGLASFEKATGLVFKEDIARTKPWRVK